jgi:hypothetical protein
LLANFFSDSCFLSFAPSINFIKDCIRVLNGRYGSKTPTCPLHSPIANIKASFCFLDSDKNFSTNADLPDPASPAIKQICGMPLLASPKKY